MKTLRPFGVTLTPKPGQPLSQYTVSLSGVGSASMLLLVMRICGIRIPRDLLPRLQIGSATTENAGTTVNACRAGRKKNQRVMNALPSTSISRNDVPENLAGEGMSRISTRGNG